MSWDKKKIYKMNILFRNIEEKSAIVCEFVMLIGPMHRQWAKIGEKRLKLLKVIHKNFIQQKELIYKIYSSISINNSHNICRLIYSSHLK